MAVWLIGLGMLRRIANKRPYNNLHYLQIGVVGFAMVIIGLIQAVFQMLAPVYDLLQCFGIAGMAAVLIRIYWTKKSVPRNKRRRQVAILGFISAMMLTLAFYDFAAEYSSPAALKPHGHIHFVDVVIGRVARINDSLSSIVKSTVGCCRGATDQQSVSAMILACIALLVIGITYWLLGQKHLFFTRHVRPFMSVFKLFLSGILVAIVGVYLDLRVPYIVVHVGDLMSRLGPGALPFMFTVVLPAWVLVASVSFNFMVSLMGRYSSPYLREQVLLITAATYRYTLGWVFLAGTVLYGPILLYPNKFRSNAAFWVIWLSAICCGIVFWRTPRPAMRPLALVIGAVHRLIPYVVLFGAVLLISFGISRWLFHISWVDLDLYMAQTFNTYSLATVWIAAAASVLTALITARLGVNSSSMHTFYATRISETYLGEPANGAPSDFEAFALSGFPVTTTFLNELLPERDYEGPIVIVNAALNSFGSDGLVHPDRKAVNFMFSPLACGYSVNPGLQVYRRTAEYRFGEEKGLKLSQAAAISGSALGTSMGYLTTSRLRFLNSILNFRLGWWLYNPGYLRPDAWTERVPRSRGSLLLSELRGRASYHRPLIHLSDGGHFENLGLYELIRRECPIVVVSDASLDPSMAFRALGNAIERCRTDFGVEIVLCTARLRKSSDGARPEARVAVGRIDYGSGKTGRLIYARPCILGDEPLDVLSYAAVHSEFPNDPTMNQWFKEPQFESYRKLGELTGAEIVRSMACQLSDEKDCRT